MKSLKKHIEEKMITEYKAQDINKDLMIDDRVISSDITEQDLLDAGWGGSFMDDRSWIALSDAIYFEKIKEDGWQQMSSQASASYGTISSKELFELIQKNKSDKGYKGELYKNNPRKIKL